MHTSRRGFIRNTSFAAACAASGCVTVNPTAPDALIIDTHQHLWDLANQRLPWLGDAPAVLRKSYRTEEYRAATAGLNVRAIYMEVDVAEETLTSEADLMLGLAASGQTPMVAAVIGGRPDAPGFADYVKRFRDNPRFKGVRRVLHSPATPAGYCLRPEFVRGVKLLGEAGKSFDLCMRAPELMDAVKLTELCPGTRFVLLDEAVDAPVLLDQVVGADAVVAGATIVRDAYGGGAPCGQHLRERSILPPRYVLGKHDQVRLEPHELLPDPGGDWPPHRAHVQVPGGDAELHEGHPARVPCHGSGTLVREPQRVPSGNY